MYWRDFTVSLIGVFLCTSSIDEFPYLVLHKYLRYVNEASTDVIKARLESVFSQGKSSVFNSRDISHFRVRRSVSSTVNTHVRTRGYAVSERNKSSAQNYPQPRSR